VIARVLALCLLWIGAAAADVPVPALSARVTDLTNTLGDGQKAALETKLEAFERAKGSQIAVLIVPTTQPEAIEPFAIRVAEAWKIGHDGVDDGVILLVAKEDRAVRIEVGYGLEGALPDVIAKRIIEEIVIPRFRAGDFYGGISAGVDRIIGVIEGEPLPPPPDRRGAGDAGPPEQALLIVLLSIALGGLVRVLHSRLIGAVVAGALAGLVGMWLIGAPAAVFVVAGFCFLLVLLSEGGGRRSGWSSGGGSWSGGGGGGFSGGGGSFGGGGASGGW